MAKKSPAKVQIVRELPLTRSGAKQVLVKRGKKYFVVSSVYALFSGFETLVFPADAKGNITDWGDVAGGSGCSRKHAIAELKTAEP
mgnify:CR=1 FL=1